MTENHVEDGGEPFLVGRDYTVGDRFPPDFAEWQRSVGIDPDNTPALDWASAPPSKWQISVGGTNL